MKNSADSTTSQHPPREYLDEYVRKTPLTALAIAAAAGFLVGGGFKNSLGLAMLGIIGRIAVQGAASSFIGAIATGSAHNGKRNGAGPDNEGYDKSRRNVHEPG